MTLNPLSTNVKKGSMTSKMSLAVSWWFLCSPTFWIWPSWHAFAATAGTALALSPAFLWRRVVQLLAFLLLPVGLLYLGNYLSVGSIPDEYFWFTMWDTNWQESTQFLRSYRGRDLLIILSWFVPATIVAIWVVRRARPVRSWWWRSLLVAVLALWLAWFTVAAAKGRSLIWALRNLQEIYPITMFESYLRQRATADTFFIIPETLPPAKQPLTDVLVLVLGESASAERWSALGYTGNPTNAALVGLGDDLRAATVLSNGNITAATVPVLLSGKSLAEAPDSGIQTYLDLARAADFEVLTFSNQGIYRPETFQSTAFRERSDRYVNLSGGAYDKEGGKYDGDLTEFLEQSIVHLQTKNIRSVLTFHMYGSHPDVALRYPPEEGRFEDPYDNSIAYSSRLLRDWIDILDSQLPDHRVVVLYISDHGLDTKICGDRYTHGTSRSAYEVPMLFWANKRFRESEGDWIRRVAKNMEPTLDDMPRYDNRVFFSTIEDLLGYEPSYPSLGQMRAPEAPMLGGQLYRTLAAESNRCRLIADSRERE